MGVDGLLREHGGEVAGRCDASVGDGDVAFVGRAPTAVVDHSVADEKIDLLGIGCLAGRTRPAAHGPGPKAQPTAGAGSDPAHRELPRSALEFRDANLSSRGSACPRARGAWAALRRSRQYTWRP